MGSGGVQRESVASGCHRAADFLGIIAAADSAASRASPERTEV